MCPTRTSSVVKYHHLLTAELALVASLIRIMVHLCYEPSSGLSLLGDIGMALSGLETNSFALFSVVALAASLKLLTRRVSCRSGDDDELAILSHLAVIGS